MNRGGKVGGEAEVGKVGRTVVDRDLPDMNAQGLVVTSGRFGCRLAAAVGRLRNQQVVDVSGAIFVDHEARIRLQQVDLVDRQALAVLVVHAL